MQDSINKNFSNYAELPESDFKDILLEEYSNHEKQIFELKSLLDEKGSYEELKAIFYFEITLKTIDNNDDIYKVEKALFTNEEFVNKIESINSSLPFIDASLTEKARIFYERKNMYYFDKYDIGSIKSFSKHKNDEYLKKNVLRLLFLRTKLSIGNPLLVELYFMCTSLEYLYYLKLDSFLK